MPLVSESKLNLTSKTLPTTRDTYRRYSRYSRSLDSSLSLPSQPAAASPDSTMRAPGSVLVGSRLSENQLVVRAHTCFMPFSTHALLCF